MNTILEGVKAKVSSREFQTGAGQVVIAVTAIVVANVTSQLVAKGLNAGLESMMDKIHGKIEQVATPAE